MPTFLKSDTSSQKHHFRAHYQSAGDVDPPAHPTGIRTDTPVSRADQVELVEKFARPRSRLRPLQPSQATEHHQVLPASQHLVKGHLLAGGHDRPPHPGRIG
jgi:hypothetical protein